MGYAKKVKGRERLFQVASILGVGVYFLEENMPASEFREWEEYLARTPSTQEVQMAQLMTMVSGFVYKKALPIEDFMIATPPKSSNDILDASVEEINRIAGVA